MKKSTLTVFFFITIVLMVGCAKVPTADPIPVEQRNGISSIVYGFISSDGRTASYTYTSAVKTNIHQAYTAGSNKQLTEGSVYNIDINSDLKDVIKNYIDSKFLNSKSVADINIDINVKDFWIEKIQEHTYRGDYNFKSSSKFSMNLLVHIEVKSEGETYSKELLIRRVIDKGYVQAGGTLSGIVLPSSTSFIDTDMAVKLTDMYNELVLRTDKFIESAKTEKPAGTSPQPQPVIKKQPDKSQDIFKIR